MVHSNAGILEVYCRKWLEILLMILHFDGMESRQHRLWTANYIYFD